LNGLSFQIIEREFRDLDEVLIWVDRNQLGRRNLTDWQRAMVMGRLYKIIKRDPVKNLKQFSDRYEFWSWDEIRRLNFSRRKGDHVTAEIIAEQIGVSEKTVRNAEKFADAVETLQEISPQAAERVLRGEVRDALTELPKVPKEALAFVASANFQRRPANRAGSLSLVALPTDWHCSRPKTLTDRNKRRALKALNNNGLNLLSPSRAQLADLPKCLHEQRATATHFFQMLKPCSEKCQIPLVSLNRPQFRVHLSRLQQTSGNGSLHCFTTATQLLRQLPNRQHRKSPRSRFTC
jgi:hypothetical protein